MSVARRALPALACAVALVVSGCANDPNSVAAQAKAGDRKGYVSGDGTIERIPVDQRAEPVDLDGTTLDGAAWSSRSTRGKVLVVNVWGSWCPPCVAEAPDLQRVWAELSSAKAPVEFIGIDSREDVASGRAFVKSRNITYPSLTDQSGVLILALQGKATTTPSTLVLDTDGRIAARVSGAVNATTLRGLIDDVLAGKSA